MVFSSRNVKNDQGTSDRTQAKIFFDNFYSFNNDVSIIIITSIRKEIKFLNIFKIFLIFISGVRTIKNAHPGVKNLR